ncbi:hypothetical protein P4E94_11720 [Pontiellaceae bacterium B12219]|nr:hypothetical protein [Pontiellaceae bacterium B12219]
MIKLSTTLGCVSLICSLHTAHAQFFTNDLTDAASIPADFNEYISSHNNATWSYTNDYALAQDGSVNTVLEGGAVLDFVTLDDDTARSYLGTVHSNWLEKSWTAHIGVETVNVNPKNYIFFGLGDPTPKESYYNEPQNGQSIFISWQSGQSNSKVGVKRNGANVYGSGVWQGDPGYDIYMTYNHVNKTVKFELDNWNGGRFSDIDITSPEISIDGFLTDTNRMHIFFGGNATMTFRDFDVFEIDSSTPPATPNGLYTTIHNMAVELDWELAGGADAYNVKRTTDSGSNYVTLASGVTDLFYTDTTVESNKTYYYVVSATNQFGESVNSAEVTGVGLPYDIIGEASSYAATRPDLEKDNLFDNDITTFYDTTTVGTYAGLDFGAGNAQQVLQIDYVLRDWGFAIARTTNATFEGSNDPDFLSGVEILHTVPTNAAAYPAVNTVTITNTTSFRYVRMVPQPGRPLYGVAEVDFITAQNIQTTANGTLHSWLDGYYNVSSLFGGDYEAADLADTDGDGHMSWEEALAGTIPTNSSSVLKVTSVTSEGSDYVITWQSVAGKNYSIITNLNLVYPNPGVAASNIVGLADETSITSSIPAAASMFFEIGVE